MYEKLVFKLFPLLYTCLHCDEGCICWHFGAPDTPGFYVGAQRDPEKNIYFIYFLFFWWPSLIIEAPTDPK